MGNLFIASALLDSLNSLLTLSLEHYQLPKFLSSEVAHCTISFTDFTSDFEFKEQFLYQNQQNYDFLIHNNPQNRVHPLVSFCMINVIHIVIHDVNQAKQINENVTEHIMNSPYFRRRFPYSIYVIVQSATEHKACVKITPLITSFRSTAPFYYSATNCGYRNFPAFLALPVYNTDSPSIKLIPVSYYSNGLWFSELTDIWLLWFLAHSSTQKHYPSYLNLIRSSSKRIHSRH